MNQTPNIFQCPHCGGEIEFNAVVRKGEASMPERRIIQTVQRGRETFARYTTLSDSTRSKFGEVASTPTFTKAERTSPARAASVESDVSVPLLQSAVTGMVFMLGSVPFVVAAHGAWYVPLLIGGGTFAIAWGVLLRAHRSLLWVVETITNRDIDQDGAIGTSPPPDVHVELSIGDEEGKRYEYEDLPVGRKGGYHGLRAFARAVTTGNPPASFAEREAAVYGYTRAEWQRLRNKFLDHNWAAWNNAHEPKQGVVLLEAGREVLRKIVTTPLPRERA